MKIRELQPWQVFLHLDSNKQLFEHMVLPRPLLEYLFENDVIEDSALRDVPFSVPVQTVQLRYMRWVVLDGTHNVAELRSVIADITNPKEFTILQAWSQKYANLSAALKSACENKTGTYRHQSEKPNVAQTPKPAVPVRRVVVVRETVPVECISFKATHELFVNTSISRRILEAATFGCRRKK